MKYLQHKSGDGRLSCEEYRKSKKVLYLRHKSCDGSLSLKRRGGAPHWRQLGPEIEREKILPTLSFATISTPTFLLFFAAETLKEDFQKIKRRITWAACLSCAIIELARYLELPWLWSLSLLTVRQFYARTLARSSYSILFLAGCLSILQYQQDTSYSGLPPLKHSK